MTKTIATIIALFLLTSCVDEKSRDNFKMSTKTCGGLTSESYNVFGQGAFGADLYGEWLTDSTSFRIFIGSCDYQNSHIIIKCAGDTIIVTKRDSDIDVDKKIYRLTELKSLDNYEK
jgi:hypothetical protein